VKRWLIVLVIAGLACSTLTVVLGGVWAWTRYEGATTAIGRTTPDAGGQVGGTQPTRMVLRAPAGATPTPSPSVASASRRTPADSTARPTRTPTPTPTPEPSTQDKIRASHPLPVRDLFSLAQRLGRLGGGARRVINPDPPQYAVGDTGTFWISEPSGKSYFEIVATLQDIGEHAAWWVEDGATFDPASLKAAAERFDQQTYPTNHQYFGREWSPGIDNDPRIQIINGYLSKGIAGYYSSSDEYPAAINPHSNEREAIYINLDAYTPGDERYDAVIAHEFQHMIHWHSDPNESTWVDEGLAELAVHLNDYDPISWSTTFTREPDTQLNAWTDVPGTAGAHYGASYLFMRYFAERFGPERVRALVASPDGDILGFDRVLAAEETTFDAVFRDWVVANYLNDPTLAGGRYGYADLNLHPHVEKILGVGESWGDVVHQFGTDYLEIHPDGGQVQVSFRGASTARVVDTDAHSGRYFYWSNRGDGSVTSLTRGFDLSGVSQATLEVWLWYDIEEFYDFAYLEVSTDGGTTWSILPGERTTTHNPTGNALGPGYSGHSGTDGNFGWVKESIDLTPYADQAIVLRWEHITDDAYNAPGLALDDIGIPEIGYLEDFEAGDGGWEAEGFVRIDNRLPQEWALQLMQSGSEPAVQPIALRNGRATFKVDAPAALAVSAMTPFTTEFANYTIAVSR
jgi:immune inhibitor A